MVHVPPTLLGLRKYESKNSHETHSGVRLWVSNHRKLHIVKIDDLGSSDSDIVLVRLKAFFTFPVGEPPSREYKLFFGTRCPLSML